MVRYISRDGDFTAELELDAEGLLVFYPRLARARGARFKGRLRAASRSLALPYASSPVALTDEQRTMLQLLLEGGQSYEDIGSLLGIAADEVRHRARSALQEIGGADPDAQVGLSDYLLGQADPIGRADAVRHLQSDPEANALAERLVQNLRLLAPKAQLPEIPEPRGGRRAAPPPPPPAPAGGRPRACGGPGAPSTPAAPKGPGFASRVAGLFSGLGGSSGKRRTQFIVGLAAALALVIVVVVVATSGGSSGASDCKGVDTSTAQQAGVPTMKLVATGAAADADCPPSGQVDLGRASSRLRTATARRRPSPCRRTRSTCRRAPTASAICSGSTSPTPSRCRSARRPSTRAAI